MDWARRFGHHEMVAFLELRGAVPSAGVGFQKETLAPALALQASAPRLPARPLVV